MDCMDVNDLEMPTFVFAPYEEIKTICPIGSCACYQPTMNIVYMCADIFIDENTEEGTFKDCHAQHYRHEYTHSIEYQMGNVVSCDKACADCGNEDSDYCDYVCNRLNARSCIRSHGSAWFYTEQCIRLPDECR